MTTPSEIKKLAYERLSEAEILYQNSKHDGAFYLAGYSVELMLKAKICERLGVPNLFDEKDQAVNSIGGIGDIRRVLKTHNLYILLIFSGLKVRFELDRAGNKNFIKANSLLFDHWNEHLRYRPVGYTKPNEVQDLIELLKDQNGLLRWIESN
jgi:hypothetical protein